MTSGIGGDTGNAPPPESDSLTEADLAVIEQMRRGEPPPQPEPEPEPAPADNKPAKASEGEEEPLDEITIDGQGRVHDASGKYVPKAAYLRERDRYKEARDRNNRLESRLDQILQSFATL